MQTEPRHTFDRVYLQTLDFVMEITNLCCTV